MTAHPQRLTRAAVLAVVAVLLLRACHVAAAKKSRRGTQRMSLAAQHDGFNPNRHAARARRAAPTEEPPEDDCIKACPEGQQLTQRSGYKPKDHVNGCHNGLVDVSEQAEMFGFTPCCDEHDLCYMTCGERMAKCEEDFAKCLRRKCGPTGMMCRTWAATFSAGTSALGCGNYLASQEEACECTAK